jgi:Ca2+/H+ antiporter
MLHHMKPLIFIVLLLTTTQAHAMFGHVTQEKERRQYAEQKLEQQEVSNIRLHITIAILSAATVTALVIGAAVGSKTRRDHEAR